MKYAFLIVIAAIALSCKKKNYYYTCLCNPKSGTGNSDALNIGRTTNEDAYVKCRAFKDTAEFNCIMQIIK